MALAPLPFYRLANVTDENGQALFPGIRLVVNLTTLAVELNKWPSEAYQQYLQNPRDIELMMAHFEHKKKLEDQEKERIEEEQQRIKTKHGMK